MTNELIIARYREDLGWIAKIPDGFRVIVYNKGPELEAAGWRDRADEIVGLPNSGRESDTFLRHVANKSVFGNGYTVFLQGDPFEHSPDLFEILDQWRSWSDVQPLSWRWLANEKRPPRSILDRERQEYLGSARVRSEVFSLTTWAPMQFFDAGSRWLDDEYRKAHALAEGINIAAHFLRRCEWHALAEQAERHMAGRFSYGALFAVRQERLRALPRRNLELALEAANGHAVYGYVLERLWLHLCGEPFEQPTSQPTSFQEDLSKLSPRFAAALPKTNDSIARRVVPALKKRALAWALT